MLKAPLRPTAVLLAVAVLVLAVAIGFYAATSRYEFANLNARQVTRRDRLTGQIELCSSHGVNEPMTCQPAVAVDAMATALQQIRDSAGR